MNVLNVLLQAGGGGAMSSIIMLVAIIVIFYFILRISQREHTTVICNIEILIGLENEIHYLLELVLNLLRSHEKVSIVLAEVTASLDSL